LANDSGCKIADKVFSGEGGNDDFGSRPAYSDFHYGVDIRSTSIGRCRVNSVSNGKVTASTQDEFSANYIDVDHGIYTTRYIHGEDRYLFKGFEIKNLDYIFTMGCTGVGTCTGRQIILSCLWNQLFTTLRI